MHKEDAQRLHNIYQIFDQESMQDGSIPGSKVVDILRMFGENPTHAEERQLLLDLDTNEDRVVSFRELCIHFAETGLRLISKSKGEHRNHLREMMKVFDTNEDGTISKSELSRLLKHMGQPLDKRELRAAFKGLDMDGNGKLSFDELLEGLEA